MMITSSAAIVRPANDQDRQSLANLVHFQMHVHRHLDWRAPLDWVGRQPYLVAERHGQPFSVLVCPPDPPEVAWIRLFAVASSVTEPEAWEMLWPVAAEELARQGNPAIAALPLQGWFFHLLSQQPFEHTCDVVVLQWDVTRLPPAPKLESVRIRAMIPADLPAVADLDRTAFDPLWRNSLDALEIALEQAALATVAESEQGIIGYQISTPSTLGGHLARLAVLPQSQRRGLGYALVYNMLDQFRRRGARRVTVNTQSINTASLAVYARAGFHPTGEKYPVFVYQPTPKFL